MARGRQQGWRGLAVAGWLALGGVVLLGRSTGTLQAADSLRAVAPWVAQEPGASWGAAGAAAWQPVGLRVSATDHPHARATLAGLGPVTVVVEPLAVEGQEGAWSRITVQAEVEQLLRGAGIRVIRAAESRVPPGAPSLAVHINAAATTTASGRRLGYAAAVRVSLIQAVQLARNPALRVDAPTWSAGLLVQGPSADIIREAVRELVEKFAYAYGVVHPPTTPSY